MLHPASRARKVIRAQHRAPATPRSCLAVLCDCPGMAAHSGRDASTADRFRSSSPDAASFRAHVQKRSYKECVGEKAPNITSKCVGLWETYFNCKRGQACLLHSLVVNQPHQL
ncbi:hypothetical protein ZWY2020_021616 [Hordeum vulgare]|nr:hypothetical protein ZWY2020_021616 [Hordeum vulgare]